MNHFFAHTNGTTSQNWSAIAQLLQAIIQKIRTLAIQWIALKTCSLLVSYQMHRFTDIDSTDIIIFSSSFLTEWTKISVFTGLFSTITRNRFQLNCVPLTRISWLWRHSRLCFADSTTYCRVIGALLVAWKWIDGFFVSGSTIEHIYCKCQYLKCESFHERLSITIKVHHLMIKWDFNCEWSNVSSFCRWRWLIQNL